MSHGRSQILWAIFAFGLFSSTAYADLRHDLWQAILIDDNEGLLRAFADNKDVFLSCCLNANCVEFAASQHSIRSLVTLLSLLKDLMPVEDTDETLLHVAVRFNCKKAVLQLLNAKFDVNRAGRYGWTPLHVAVSKGFIGATRILLERGARHNVGTRASEYPVHLAVQAVRERRLRLLRLLKRFGADLSVVNIDRRNALHFAAAPADTAGSGVIEYLVKRGVRACKDRFEQMPLDIAGMHECIDGEPRLLPPSLQSLLNLPYGVGEPFLVSK